MRVTRSPSPSAHDVTPAVTRAPTRVPGLLLGVGFGAFVDGIVFHQLLQWHHLVSDVEGYPTDTVAGLEAHAFWDGVFHAVAWVVAVAGVAATLHARRRGTLSTSYRSHLGLVVSGWGLFTLFDGVVNHALLGLHRLREDLGGPVSWEVGYVVTAVLLAAAGWWLHRGGEGTRGA